MRVKALALAATALIAWALKQHYSVARADDLLWVLTPTAHIVSVVTETPFAWQPGEGYFSRDRLFLIEKSCAGINFMIAAFVMVVLAVRHRVKQPLDIVRVMGVGLLASYAAAVCVNATRIAIALWLAGHPTALRTFSAAEVHRIEGVAVYFAGLVLLHELVRRLDVRSTHGSVV